MLSISNVTPQQGAEYFKEENYYSKEEAQEQSKWFGVSAASLGLSGNVDGEQFKNLLNGYSPDGKKVLSGKKIDPENRRAGFDMTFSAPKSVSLAALYGGDKNLELAHYTAVDRALRIYEQQYAQARVWDGKQQQKVNTGNIVAAQFHHTTSREKDPQLHTHCIVLNCTQLENGKWRALTNEELYNNEMLLGAIYRNELACEARKLGYETENRPDGLFEIKGYTQFQLEWFSKRRQQIVELVGENATAQEKDWAALQTRAPKGKELPREEQLGWWQAQNEAFNLQIKHPIPQPVTQTTISDNIVTQKDQGALSAAAAVLDAIEHCSERTVGFKRKALEKFIFSEIKSFSYAELERAIANDPELIATFDGAFTTHTAINRELATIKLMQQGKSQVSPIADQETLKLHLAEKTLTQGQHEAIALLATTDEQFVAWQGVAGAGKTYALNEFRALAQERGYTIKGFAPSSEAAKVLGEEVGIESNTVASLLVSKQPEDSNKEQIWIVDEAGLLSAKDAHNLLLLATKQKARVVLVGDTKQLSAVEAGNPFKSLQSAGMQTAYLNQSLRQRVKDLQESVDLVAAGKADLGISKLDAAGRIAVIPDAEERLTLLVKDYMALPTEERAKTLVLAGTNSDRVSITHSIRQELKAAGVLGETATLTQLKAKDLTQVQARYSHHYAVGDVVVPAREYKRLGLTKFQPYIVEALDKNSLTLKATDGTAINVDPMAFRKTLYNQQSVEIAVGERLKWTCNNRQLGRRNGQEFVVTAINGNRAQVMYSNSKTDQVDLNQLQHLDYALVSTTYSSQGKTADRVLIAADKTMGKESFYVAVSRAKYDLKIYTKDKKDLLKLAQRTRAKETALELVNSRAVAIKSEIANQPPTTTKEETTYERTNLSLGSQPINDKNSNLEQEQITHDIKQEQSSSEGSSYERDSLIDRENWAVGNEPQSLDRTNPTARKNSDRELESVAIKLPELLETISRYIELQEIEQLGADIAELNRSLANGGFRGQGTASFPDRASGQNPTAIDNATGDGSIERQSTESEQLLSAISNPAVEAIKERFEVEVIESKEIVQDLEKLTSCLNLHQEQEFKEKIQKLNLALPSLIEQLNQQVTSALEQQATEAISNYIKVETCELALASQNLPSLSRQLAKLQHQELTEAMRQLAGTVEAVSSLTTQHLSNQTIEAIAKHIDRSAVGSVISEPSGKLTQYLAGQATLPSSIEQLDAVISDCLAQIKTKTLSLEQRGQERAILALSNYVEHSAVDSALVESLSSLEEQFCQHQKQLASNLTNSNLKALLLYLKSISKPDEIKPLAKARSLPSESNTSTDGQLPSKNEQQWTQIRRYLIERRCLPARLVDGIHAAGKLYADSSGRAVFLQSNIRGQVTGAKALDIKDGRFVSKSQLTLGATGDVGYFQLTQGKGKLSRIVLTTSPIEAMSLAALEKGQRESRTIYIDINKQRDIPRLQELINSGVRVEVAFGADEASEVKAQQMIDSFPGLTRRKPACGRSWNEQLRRSHQRNRKPTEPKFQQRFDPKQQLLEVIKSDRERYKSAYQVDLKTAIKGLVAGRTFEQISQDIASISSLVKHWETSGQPSTQAIAKTIKYVEQLCAEAQSEPAYYHQLYHRYLKEAQKNNPYLSRAELDRAVASVALRSHSQESVRAMLKYSLAAQVGDDEYVEQTLAVVRQETQLAQEPRQKTHDCKPQDLEYGD